MADLFTGTAPVADAFQGVNQQPVATKPPTPLASMAPKLAALATTTPDPEGMIKNLQDATKKYEDLMAVEGDTSTRRQIAADEQLKEYSKFVDLYHEAPGFDPTGEVRKGSILAANAVLQEGLDRREEYAMEQKAIKNIQALATSGDDSQARLLLDNLERGGPTDVLTDLNTKQLILQREIERAGIDVKNQSWAADFVDFFMGTHVPYLNTPDTGNIPVDDALKHWYDGLLGGWRQESETNSLWQLNPADFAKTLREVVLPAVQSNATFLGYHSNSSELNILTKMQRTPSVLEQNIWDSVDNVGFVPFARIGKMGSWVSLLIKNGARKEAGTLVAQAAKDIVEKGTLDAAEATGVPSEEVEKNLLPSFLDSEADLDNLSFFNARGEVYKNPNIVETPTGPRVLGRDFFVSGDTVDMKVAGDLARKEVSQALKEGKSVTLFVDGKPINIVSVTKGSMRDAEGKPWGSAWILSDKGGKNRIEISGGKNTTSTVRGLPTIETPTGPVALKEVPIQEGANSIIEKTSLLLDSIVDLSASGRLTKQELAEAVQAKWAEISKNVDRPLKDVSGSSVTLSDGSLVHKLELTLGKEAGDGFKSEAALHENMMSLGYHDYVAVKDASGQWFARISPDVRESGFYTQPLNPQATNWFSRKLLGARKIGDKFLADQAQLSGNTRNKVLKGVIKPYVDKIHAVSNSERADLAQVMQAGESEGKWWTRDELNQMYVRGFKRDVTDREWEAYTASRTLNDIEYVLRNDDLYKKLVTSGYETVSFDTGIGRVDAENAIVNRSLDKSPDLRTYNISDHLHYTKRMTEDEVATLRANGYLHIITQEPVRLADGTTVKSFVAKAKDVNLRNLRRDQIGYRAGGHRIYEGKYFVKQASVGVQEDTGAKFLKNPETFVALDTRAQADFWAERMEAARNVMARSGSKVDVQDALGTHAGMPTADEFMQGVKDGSYRLDQPFEALYDREMPSEYSKINTDIIDYVDREETGLQGFLRTNGRLYYSSKGAQLRDFQGSLAPTLDPFKTLNRALTNVAQLSSFSDYKSASVSRWVESFKQFTDYGNLEQGASDWRVFNDSRVRPEVSDRIKQGIEAQRDVIRANIGWRSEADRQSEQITKRLAEWVGGVDPDNGLRQGGEKLVRWFDSKSPVMALRGLAFDAKLGMFNIGQLPLQISTMWAIGTMAGTKRTFEAMMSGYPLRAFLTKSGTEDMLGHFADKSMWKSMGFGDADEMKAYMRAAKNSGFFDFAGSHQLINSYGPNAALSDIGNKLDKIRQAGRFFFYEGETWNRLAAFRVAWGETRDRFPKLATDSIEFKTALAGRAEDYAFSMSEQSQAYWQRGALSIPTQFWAYNARMAEAMFGKAFTGQQRAKLILGQMFLAGSAALPLTSTLMGLYKTSRAGEAKTDDYRPDSWRGMLDRGLLDTVIYEMTNADVLAGKRYGTGNFWDDTVKSVFGISQYGEKSVADVMVGATGGIMASLGYEVLSALTKWAISESGGQLERPLTSDDFTKMASTVSTVGNGLKAYMVFKYGTYASSSGTLIKSGLPSQDAFGVALGLQLGTVDETSSMLAYLKNHKDAVDEAAKQIANFRTRAWEIPANAEDYRAQVNAFVKLLPDDIRAEALREANRYTPQSVYDSARRRIEKDQAQRALLSNQGQ